MQIAPYPLHQNNEIHVTDLEGLTLRWGFGARWKWRLLGCGCGRRWTPFVGCDAAQRGSAALHKIRDPKRGEASQHLGPRQASLLV